MRSLFRGFSVSMLMILVCGCSRDQPSPVLLRIDDSNNVTVAHYSALASGISSNRHVSTHRVAEDETLFDVAYRYNIDPINLAKINGIKHPYIVKEGRILRLPSTNFVPGDVYADGESVILSDYASSAPDNERPERKGNEIPEFADESSNKSRHSHTTFQDEFSKKFEKIIALDSPKDASKLRRKIGGNSDGILEKSIKSSPGTSFDEQATMLSTPKITQTVNGKLASGSGVGVHRESSSKLAAVGEKAKEEGTRPDQPQRLQKPVTGTIVSNFGDNNNGVPNDGINIKAKLGSSVHAAAKGTVIYVGNNLEEDFGNLVIVQHDNGLITSYAHLKDICVKKDSRIDTNTKIGTVGKTGDVSEPQLHFEVMEGKKPVDPKKYIK